MADDGNLRVQRHRRHKANDHSLCHPDRCRLAPWTSLPDYPPAPAVTAGAPVLAQVRREFAAHPLELSVAERWAEQAAGDGPVSVQAGRQLLELRWRLTTGRLPTYDGPVTITDEVRAQVDSVIRIELARRLDRLEAEVEALGWPAALAALRVELVGELGEIGEQEARREADREAWRRQGWRG